MRNITTRRAAHSRLEGNQKQPFTNRTNPPTAQDIRTGDQKDDLVGLVVQKRTEVEKYLTVALARQRRLLNLTTIAGACASALLAAPTLGGKPLMDWLTSTFGLFSPSWQVICAVAAACSLMVTVATQMLQTHNTEDHVAQAQSVHARLQMLEVGLKTGDIDHAEASTEYQKSIENANFIHGA